MADQLSFPGWGPPPDALKTGEWRRRTRQAHGLEAPEATLTQGEWRRLMRGRITADDLGVPDRVKQIVLEYLVERDTQDARWHRRSGGKHGVPCMTFQSLPECPVTGCVTDRSSPVCGEPYL